MPQETEVELAKLNINMLPVKQLERPLSSGKPLLAILFSLKKIKISLQKYKATLLTKHFPSNSTVLLLLLTQYKTTTLHLISKDKLQYSQIILYSTSTKIDHLKMYHLTWLRTTVKQVKTFPKVY